MGRCMEVGTPIRLPVAPISVCLMDGAIPESWCGRAASACISLVQHCCPRDGNEMLVPHARIHQRDRQISASG